MSRVFLKKFNFFFEKLKILLYNVRNISERYGGYRMGIFIVAIFLLLIGYLFISMAKISGEKANEIKKSLENNKENLLETKGTLELIKIEGGKNSRSFD